MAREYTKAYYAGFEARLAYKSQLMEEGYSYREAFKLAHGVDLGPEPETEPYEVDAQLGDEYDPWDWRKP